MQLILQQDEVEEMDEFEADMQKEMEQRVYQAEKVKVLFHCQYAFSCFTINKIFVAI